MENIIQLKFSLEREIEALTRNFDLYEFKSLIIKTPDERTLFTQYNTNKTMFGKNYLTEQKVLLEEVNKILLEKCEHNWIEDYIDEPLRSRYICYCSKCYIYNSKAIG